jgi:hypothetical protein
MKISKISTIKRKQWQRSSFLEKILTINFIGQAKFYYGPKATPDSILFLSGTRKWRRWRGSVVNVFFLMKELRKTLRNTYAHSYHRGMIVISGIGLQQFSTIGAKCFYFFSPWSPGFLTNFSILHRHVLMDKMQGKLYPRHISLNAVEIKRKPQIPSYSVGLNLQHFHYNEAKALRLQQTITIDSNLPITPYYATCILPSKNAIIPAITLTMMIRESILAGRQDDKIYFTKPLLKKIKKVTGTAVKNGSINVSKHRFLTWLANKIIKTKYKQRNKIKMCLAFTWLYAQITESNIQNEAI